MVLDNSGGETPAAASDGPGMDRRTLIKRAAATGAVVAWATPTVQVLSSRPAGAQETGTVEYDCDSLPGGQKMVNGFFTMQWTGTTCAAPNQGTAKSTCSTDLACAGTNDPVEIRFLSSNTGIITQHSGGTLDATKTILTSFPKNGTFTIGPNLPGTKKLTKNLTFQIWVNGVKCQESTWHISCSDPDLQGPGVQIGGLLYTAWNPPPP
jgi:hypothetical protein